jgi:hypothetical protein
MKRTSLLSLLVVAGLLCSSCAGAIPLIKTITQIATDLCIQQESQSLSADDTNIDTYCRDEQVLADIEHGLLGVKRSFALKHHAMPDADAGTAPLPENPF